MELELESILLPGIEENVLWLSPVHVAQRQKNKLWIPPGNCLRKE